MDTAGPLATRGARWRRVGAVALRVAIVLGVVAACALFFRHIDWQKLRGVLAGARWSLVCLAAAINFFHLLFKAMRWGVLLSPVGHVSLIRLFRYQLGGYAASNLLPARFGEVLRVFLLRPHGIPIAGAAGAQALEKIYDAVSLLLVVLPLPFLLDLPRTVSKTIALLAVAGILGALAMVWIAWSARSSRLLGRFGHGVAVLRSGRKASYALLLSLASWGVDTTMAMLVLLAVGVAPSIAMALLALLFINFAIAVPSTPAQVGAFEAAGALALGLLGVDPEKALAFAFLYHFMQAIPVTLAGLEVLLLWRSSRKVEGTG